MALNLTSFPINTSDGTASESSIGLCPIMYQDVTASGNTATVNSEYGVRKGIGDSLSGAVSGLNYGVGAPVYAGNTTDPLNVYADVRSVTSYSPRFVFEDTGNGLTIGYDGSYGSSYFSTSSHFVQGGSLQALGHLNIVDINGSYTGNYFGDGTDGVYNVTSDTYLQSTTDGDAVVLHTTQLNVAAGTTLTTLTRCKALIAYVQGDLNVDGTITMTARGANVDPIAAGVPVSGLQFIRSTPGGTQSLTSSVVNGMGSSAITAEAKQLATSTGTLFTISRGGAAAKVSGSSGDTTGTAFVFENGNDGTTGKSGSGGTGVVSATSNAWSTGAAGTCFGGGSGGGAAIGGSNLTSTATANGGKGGDGVGSAAAGSGAGNPAGTPANSGLAGSTGTGGTLILIVGGNVRVSSTGSITANGSNGNGSLTLASGGASGGGNILILYAGQLINSGTISANGGTSGTWSTTTARAGHGSVQIAQVSEQGSFVGFSDTLVPVCANMQNTSMMQDHIVSGAALNTWNSDVAIAKISVKTPVESAFSLSGVPVAIGYRANEQDLFTQIGAFTTRNRLQVQTEGEEIPLVYTQNMYQTQYVYFTTPSTIVAYMSGAVLGLTGEADVRVFFDQVKYSYGQGVGVYPSSSTSDGSNVTSVVKVDFSTVFPSVQGSMGSPREYAASASARSFSYLAGGLTLSGTTTTTIQRYSTSYFNATAQSRSALSVSRGKLSAAANYNFGWFFGGLTNNTTPVATIDRLSFSDDTTSASSRASLVNSQAKHTSFTERTSPANTWICGGGIANDASQQAFATVVQKYTFATDTSNASNRATLASASEYSGRGSSTTKGWVFDGYSNSSTSSVVQSLTFSNDTAATIAELNDIVARKCPANSTSLDGSAQLLVGSSVTKITFANSTAALETTYSNFGSYSTGWTGAS